MPDTTTTKIGTTRPRPQVTRRTARILIVDDHPIVRRGLAALIGHESDLVVCGEAADAPAAIRQVQETQPDLAVVDITLNDGNGIDLIKQLKAHDDRLKTLVASMHDETLYAERALRAGAMGYINKEEATDHIVEAIRRVLRGDVYLSGRMTERLLRRVAGLGSPEQPPLARLSDRELEIFELIGHGLTARQIAAKLYVSIKTIETHRDNIRAKLNLANSTQLTCHAVERVVRMS